MEANRSEHLRKNITGVCLIAAPLVMLVGQIIHPVDETDAAAEAKVVADNLDRWFAAHLIILVALALLIPAILGLAHLIHERRPTMAYVGGGLSLIGVVAVAAVAGADGIAGYFVAAASPDSPTTLAFFDGVINSGRMMALYLPTLLLGLGLLVTAVGLYRSQVVAPWSAMAIGLGAVLVDIGYPAAIPAVIVAGLALLLVGTAPIGYSVLTETDSAWAHTPEFHGFRPPSPTPA